MPDSRVAVAPLPQGVDRPLGNRFLTYLFKAFQIFFVFDIILKLFAGISVLFGLLDAKQNHAESIGNFLKNSALDPKCVKFDQKSSFGVSGGRPGGRRAAC